ncbi:NAD(P)H-dependent oxidoreductase [Paremcibacter congregatus]|uniref:NAD(P)H-dependent oxidoreductase n=1 Tax=Paremcibacter congregatus TaxID=2043170 RepID=UPI0030EEE5BE
MKTILIISGQETTGAAKGNYNRGLARAARDFLAPHFTILTTDVEDSYDPQTEIEKFKQADAVIYQYPVFWFTVPSRLKHYIDQVYAYDVFFGQPVDRYGSGGLMEGKKVMLSTTWNAPSDAFNDTTAFFEGLSVEEALLPMRKTHTYCGFTELPHFSVHDIVVNPDFEADRARLEDHLQAVFNL